MGVPFRVGIACARKISPTREGPRRPLADEIACLLPSFYIRLGFALGGGVFWFFRFLVGGVFPEASIETGAIACQKFSALLLVSLIRGYGFWD